MLMNKIALTGIKPTGTPHIGNYLGMIKPALGLVESYRIKSRTGPARMTL